MGNMTRAAQALHVTQPSLGAQIKQLEMEVEVELLERKPRGVSPTLAGKFFYQRALRILVDIETLQTEVRDIAVAKKRTVKLGVPASAIRLLGSDILADAEIYAPGVTLELIEQRSSILYDALRRGELDIALCYNAEDNPNIIRTPIFEEELLFILSPNSAAPEDPVSTSDVLKSRLGRQGRDPGRDLRASRPPQPTLVASLYDPICFDIKEYC